MRDRWITDWVPSARWPHYTRANSGEVAPTPASPLSVTYTWDNGICQGWRDGYVGTGCFSIDEFDRDHPEACGFFGGYMYINLSNVRMQGVRNPAVTVEQLDLAFFGDHPDVPPYVAMEGDDRPDLVPKIMSHLEWQMTSRTWPRIDQEREQTIALRAGRPDLRSLTDAQLLARAREVQQMIVKLFDSHTLSSSGSGIAPSILFAVGQAIGDPTVPMKLVAGLGEVDSAEPSLRMWQISRLIRSSEILTRHFDAGVEGLRRRLEADGSEDARRFLEEWDGFIGDFGARAANEYEISAETWETRPELALATLERVRFQSDDESPDLRLQKRVAEREQTTAEVRARLRDLGNEDLIGQFEAALVASSQLAFRERTKTNLIRAVHEARMVFRELGRRHAEAGHLESASHVFQLLDSELEAFAADPAKFKDELAGREAEWKELFELEPPFIIRDGRVPPLGDWPRRGSATTRVLGPGESVQAVAGCPGKVTGRARVIMEVGDPGELEPGEILVAPVTDPGWASLFMAAAGVVVEVGGQISHAIIVSRELGLPCVVSATGACRAIPNGAVVEVDGDNGTVTVVSVPSPAAG
ncbi:MAG TPA: PEP-utilizing enzyme [Acidimicrobiales bacterium]|nr:PEP-utilizing enzyme [Acidimicrobiales bacterium]